MSIQPNFDRSKEETLIINCQNRTISVLEIQDENYVLVFI